VAQGELDQYRLDRYDMVNPIFVALDVDTDTAALSLAHKLKGKVGGFKVGPRLTLRFGRKLISDLAECAPVFVDNKYYDIPSTMVAAMQATFEAGATFATIHAQCGPEALKALSELQAELREERPFHILSVTVLTSYSPETIPPNWQNKPLLEHVETLAQATFAAGIKGIVCSPEEVAVLRKQNPSAFLVTPGIRLSQETSGDQKRVMTPPDAMQAGASALVIGRPILQAPDPLAAVESILNSLKA
jgi:orotidine-5'-phosphate decarboxylase